MDSFTYRRARMNQRAFTKDQFAMQRPNVSTKANTAMVERLNQRMQLNRRERWQQEAFDYYDDIGEVAFLVNITANSISLCDLIVEETQPDGTTAVSTDERALRVMECFVGPVGGLSELLRGAALNLLITGDCYLVGTPLKNKNNLMWEFLSCEEIIFNANGNFAERRRRVLNASSRDREVLDPDTYIARLWKRHPRFSDDSDSNLRHCLLICRELLLLTRLVSAISRSRIHAGILYIPLEMSFGSLDESEGTDGETDDIDPLTEQIVNFMISAYEDPESPSAVAPLIVHGPGDQENHFQMKTLGEGRNLDAWAVTLRHELIQRLGAGMDVPPEILHGKQSINQWCADDKTEILTSEGWVTHDRLTRGVPVLTLNHETGMSEWQPVLAVNRFEADNQTLVKLSGSRHSSLTTKNHRSATLHAKYSDGKQIGSDKVWKVSEELNTCDSIIVSAVNSGIPTKPVYEDGFVELVAWFWTESSCQYRDGRLSPKVTIYQSQTVNPLKVERIRKALGSIWGAEADSLGSGGGSTRNDVPLWRSKQRNNSGASSVMTEFVLNSAAADRVVSVAPNKIVSTDFIRSLTSDQLRLFIDASVAADGTVNSSGSVYITQKNRDMLEAVELAAVLLGKSTNLYWDNRSQWVLNISDRDSFRIYSHHISEEQYSGIVWCPTTENQTWFARREGKTFYTGNSGYQITTEFYTKHIAPLGAMITEFIESSYLHPMLVAYEGMTPAEASKFKLSFDASAIQIRNDEGTTALRLYREGAISQDALRRYSGFTEADAPSKEEEIVERAIKLIGIAPISLGPQLLPMVPGFEDVEIPTEPYSGGSANPRGPQSNPNRTVDQVRPGGEVRESVGPAGGGQPKESRPGNRPGGPQTHSISTRLLIASDSAFERAYERAASKYLSKANLPARDQLRSVDKLSLFSLIAPSDIEAIGETPRSLFNGSFERLEQNVKPWVRSWLETEHNVTGYIADDEASHIASSLRNGIEQFALVNLHSQVKVFDNNTRVPSEIVESALGSSGRSVGWDDSLGDADGI